ncbi:MAG: TIGR02206 family membrane protein [Candidatus Dormiibacterota bacterium]
MSGLLSAEHLGALIATAVFAAITVVAARTNQGPWIKGLAVVLVADELSWWIFLIAGGQPNSPLVQSLPLQLCDVAIFVAALALWFRSAWLVELTWFWGLAGSLQALLTPDLPQHFPSYPYLQYYIAHGGIVAAALLLVIGLGLRPRALGVVRAAALTVAYVAFVGIVDAVTGSNYMYLRSKPPSPTLLDVMGPWPWYLVSAAGVGVVLFAVLEAPFMLRLRRGRSAELCAEAPSRRG